MKRPRYLLPVLALLLLAFTASRGQCPNSTEVAQCEMTAGIDFYKNAHYEESIAHFRRATELDPRRTRAHLYLGTALAQRYIPGADTRDNVRYAEQAIAEFSAVLRQQTDNSPDKLNATREIAWLYLNMKRFEDAKRYYRKQIDIDPKDSAAYYTIAVIDWTESYQQRMEARAKLGLKLDEPLTDLATCYQFAQDDLARVQDGVTMLTKALELRPDYDDAMAYMNLMHRERADLRCNDPAGRAADLAEADKWVRLTLTTKKAKAEQGHHDKPAHDGDCSMYLYAPPQVPTQNKCVYSEYVEIGHAVVKTREGAANFRVSFKADFFHGLERTSTPHGFEFRKAGQPVTEYPDTLTVIIEPADFRLGASVATATLSGTRCSDSAGITTTAGDGEVAGCPHRVIQSKSGELREVVEPWPELRAPRVWYVAEIAGIKQLLATEVELVVTGKGNTPLADVRGGLVYSSAPASREPTSK